MTIVWRMSRSAIATLLDQASRRVRLVHLPHGHSAEAPVALVPILNSLPETERFTLTWDQGSEMAHHDQLANHDRDGIFFAHPQPVAARHERETPTGCYGPRRHQPVRARLRDPARG